MEIKDFEMMSSCDGLRLAGSYSANENSLKGIIHFVHGMSEHKERYYNVMKFLSSKGYACVILDNRGHGKSVKCNDDLGYFYDTSATYFIKDLHQLYHSIKKDSPDVPYILFGHSMGSLLVRAYVKAYDDVDALIVCGSPSENKMALPALWLAQLMTKIKGDHYRSPLIQKMAFSSYSEKFLENYSENVWLSKYRANVDAYDEDPLCGFVFTLNGFQNLFRLLKNVYSKKGWNVSQHNLPILFIAGEDDPCITSPSAFKDAYNFLKTVGYQHVDHHLFKGMRHEILNEQQHQEVYDYIEEWLYANVN